MTEELDELLHTVREDRGFALYEVGRSYHVYDLGPSCIRETADLLKSNAIVDMSIWSSLLPVDRDCK